MATASRFVGWDGSDLMVTGRRQFQITVVENDGKEIPVWLTPPAMAVAIAIADGEYAERLDMDESVAPLPPVAWGEDLHAGGELDYLGKPDALGSIWLLLLVCASWVFVAILIACVARIWM